MYAFTSAADTNGSAFAGLNANTDFYNITLAVAMPVGRHIPIILIIALAWAFSQQSPVAVTSGTLPVTVIVSVLSFLPAPALGPLSEGL